MEQNIIKTTGDCIREEMERLNYDTNQMIEMIGISTSHFKKILDGEEFIGEDIAEELAKITNLNKKFWLRVDEKYANNLKELNR